MEAVRAALLYCACLATLSICTTIHDEVLGEMEDTVELQHSPKGLFHGISESWAILGNRQLTDYGATRPARTLPVTHTCFYL